MAQLATIVLASLGFIFGVLGFLAGCWATINVLGFQRSTHRITQMPVETLPETTIEDDLPQHIRDQLPSPAEKLTAAEYARWEARQQAEIDFNEL